MKIRILLYDGFDELDAIAPYEVFQMAGAESFEPKLVSLQADVPIQSAHGLCLQSQGTLSLSDCNLLMIPGGGWADRSERGAWAEFHKPEIPRLIRQAYEEKILLASVCTGAMLLAKAGVLKGRKAATHRSAWEDLERLGSEVVPFRVADDGDILSSGGVTSGIDLALWIVERFASAEIAEKIRDKLEYPQSLQAFKG